jgi:hypothetical protein
MRHSSFIYVFMTTEDVAGGPHLTLDEAWERLVKQMVPEDPERQSGWFYHCRRLVLVGNWQGQVLELIEQRRAMGYRGTTTFDLITFDEMKNRVGEHVFQLAMTP